LRGFCNKSAIKLKVYLILEKATEAQRGNIYSYTLSLTSALDGGVVKATPRPPYPREGDMLLIVQESVWAQGTI
jgi:hypothetical protein